MSIFFTVVCFGAVDSSSIGDSRESANNPRRGLKFQRFIDAESDAVTSHVAKKQARCVKLKMQKSLQCIAVNIMPLLLRLRVKRRQRAVKTVVTFLADHANISRLKLGCQQFRRATKRLQAFTRSFCRVTKARVDALETFWVDIETKLVLKKNKAITAEYELEKKKNNQNIFEHETPHDDLSSTQEADASARRRQRSVLEKLELEAESQRAEIRRAKVPVTVRRSILRGYLSELRADYKASNPSTTDMFLAQPSTSRFTIEDAKLAISGLRESDWMDKILHGARHAMHKSATCMPPHQFRFRIFHRIDTAAIANMVKKARGDTSSSTRSSRAAGRRSYSSISATTLPPQILLEEENEVYYP